MTEPWEPWIPEVGQQVRVRLSGECTATYTVDAMWYGDQVRHEPWPIHDVPAENGMCGQVRAVYPFDVMGSHRFEVVWQQVIGRQYGSTYAALELEPDNGSTE